jgi:hypothetical protein
LQQQRQGQPRRYCQSNKLAIVILISFLSKIFVLLHVQYWTYLKFLLESFFLAQGVSISALASTKVRQQRSHRAHHRQFLIPKYTSLAQPAAVFRLATVSVHRQRCFLPACLLVLSSFWNRDRTCLRSIFCIVRNCFPSHHIYWQYSVAAFSPKYHCSLPTSRLHRLRMEQHKITTSILSCHSWCPQLYSVSAKR